MSQMRGDADWSPRSLGSCVNDLTGRRQWQLCRDTRVKILFSPSPLNTWVRSHQHMAGGAGCCTLACHFLKDRSNQHSDQNVADLTGGWGGTEASSAMLQASIHGLGGCCLSSCLLRSTYPPALSGLKLPSLQICTKLWKWNCYF